MSDLKGITGKILSVHGRRNNVKSLIGNTGKAHYLTARVHRLFGKVILISRNVSISSTSWRISNCRIT